MSDLDKLKDLLFGAEKQVLDSISERVVSRELRSADVADILPEAIHSSHRNGPELSDSLRDPVGECLQRAFRDDPQTYSDALYPVMGPAIRKSIMHTLRTFAQQINEAVEQSLTPKGLSWRLQAWRAGVPFGDFVLQRTLLYRVEQAYLISRENGLLMGHAQHEAARIKDSDAVSAMFTAIQDFVKESFSPDRSGRLESADMGEFTLWAVHGPHALLVCVIRGVPPRALRTDLSAILERIHFRYGEAIRSYGGDTTTVPGVEEELEACLRLEAKQEQATSQKGLPLPLLMILLLLAAGIAYWLVTGWLQQEKLDRLTAAIDDTPGLMIIDATASRRGVSIRGLRDPLAPEVATIAASVDLSVDDVSADMRPYYSLDPALVAERAALARAEELLRRNAEIQRLTTQAMRLAEQQFHFTSGTTLTEQTETALAIFVRQLTDTAAQLAEFEVGIDAKIIGHSDTIGGPEVNAIIALQRAEIVAAALAERGWSGNIATDSAFDTVSDATVIDLSQRRVTIELTTTQ